MTLRPAALPTRFALSLVASWLLAGAPAPATGGTQITWHVLAQRGPDELPLSTRFEIVARGSDGVARRLGPITLPCYVTDGPPMCTYGGASDYLRVRRQGSVCTFSRQLSTEHGMQRPHALGTLPCTAPLTVSVDYAPGVLPDAGAR